MTHPYLDNVNMSNFLGRKHIFGSILWKTRSLVPLICGTVAHRFKMIILVKLSFQASFKKQTVDFEQIVNLKLITSTQCYQRMYAQHRSYLSVHFKDSPVFLSFSKSFLSL